MRYIKYCKRSMRSKNYLFDFFYVPSILKEMSFKVDTYIVRVDMIWFLKKYIKPFEKLNWTVWTLRVTEPNQSYGSINRFVVYEPNLK